MTGQQSSTSPQSGNLPRFTWWKKACFASAAFLLFFVGLEVILYLFGVQSHLVSHDPFVGFEGHVPLFVAGRSAEAPPMMKTAENKIRFFNEQQFPMKKRPNTTRIFCLGGSTTYGRPYGDATSYSAWLRELLPAADADRKWEVINAGGISYASYRVATLMEELSQYKPDLFIVYTGHNEFLEKRTYKGIIETPVPVRGASLLLHRMRTVALISNLTREEPQPPIMLLPSEVVTRMEHTVGLEAYTRDDKLKAQIVDHYRYNLIRMIDLARSAGAKLLFVTPASNLRNCSPFKSEHTTNLSESQRQQFNAHFLAYRKAMRKQEFVAAVEASQELVAIDQRHAHARYWHAAALDAAGRHDEARAEYETARREDVCPLRADSDLMDVMRGVAADFDVPIVDFVRFTEKEAPQRIPGDEMFLDHVHLTISGHGQLALLLIDEMERQKWLRTGAGWNEQAITGIRDKVNGRVDRKQHGRAMRNIAQVLSLADKDADAYRAAKKAVELAPNDAEANYLTAALAYQLEDFDVAFEHYRRLCATPLDPSISYADKAHLEYGILLLQRGHLDHSLAQLAIVTQRDPDNKEAGSQMLTALVLRARQLLRQNRFTEAEPLLKKAVVLYPEGAETWNYLGIVYWKTDRLELAQQSFRTAIEANSEYPEAHNNLGSVLAQAGELREAEVEFTIATKIRPKYEVAKKNLEQVRAQRQANQDADE